VNELNLFNDLWSKQKPVVKKTLSILTFLLLGLGTGAQNSPATKVFPGVDSLSCLRFEYSEGKMYVLSDLKRSYKINYLQLTDSSGHIKKSMQVPGNFTQMFRTWNSKIYIGTTDTVWQVFLLNDSLRLVYPALTAKLKATMMAFIYQGDGVMFKREEAFLNLRTLVHLVYQDENSKTIDAVVHKVVDTAKVDYLKLNLIMKHDRSRSSPDHYDYENMSGVTTKEYEEYVMMTDKRSYEQLINGPKINLAVNYYNEKFYLFDCTNGNIVHMDRLLTKKEMVNLEGMEKSNDNRKAMVDEMNGNFYCLEKSDHAWDLKRYDPETGKLIYSKSFAGLRTAENFRVNGGELYYIVKTDADSPSQEILKIHL